MPSPGIEPGSTGSQPVVISIRPRRLVVPKDIVATGFEPAEFSV